MPTRPVPPLRYPIRAVARMTGLSIDTLRAWERRYEAVRPERSARGRVYSPADVERLRRLAALVASGHAIGAIAHLPDATLARLIAKPPPRDPAAEPRSDLRPLTAALDRYDVSALELALNQFASVLPPRELIFAVVLPLLQLVGRLWEEGTIRPPQEHLVSSTLRTVLGSLLRVLARAEPRRRAVFATTSGERHELGLLCAAVLAAVHGLGVIYLGADLPAEDIVDAATRAEADLIVVGVTTREAVSTQDLRRLARAPEDVGLWIGGPAMEAARKTVGDRATYITDLVTFADMLDERRQR